MTTGENLFLLLCEELNFSRAAKRAYISQQSFSDHIARLESQYKTRLFTRRPKVSLTLQGIALRKALLSVREIENGLNEELIEIENGKNGILRVGMNLTVSQIIMPILFERYSALYQSVLIDIYTGETIDMQRMLDKGELNCFIGINSSISAGHIIEELSTENLYLMLSRAYIKNNPILSGYNAFIPADISILNNIPLIMDRNSSTTSKIIKNTSDIHGIKLHTVLTMHTYDVSAKICRNGKYGFFCNDMMKNDIIKENVYYNDDMQLQPIKIKNLENSIHFSLVYKNSRHYPKYAVDFFKLLHETIREFTLT